MAIANAQLRDEYEGELLKELDTIDRLREEAKEEAKLRRKDIERHERSAKRFRDLLAGREHEQLDLEQLVGTREDAIAQHEERKPTAAKPKEKMVPGLVWRREGANLTAETSEGTYCIEPSLKGGFNLLWTPAGGKSKSLEFTATEPAAKDLARKHQLERQADGILANAGAGALTKADTKGAAVARKKGGRR